MHCNVHVDINDDIILTKKSLFVFDFWKLTLKNQFFSFNLLNTTKMFLTFNNLDLKIKPHVRKIPFLSIDKDIYNWFFHHFIPSLFIF